MLPSFQEAKQRQQAGEDSANLRPASRGGERPGSAAATAAAAAAAAPQQSLPREEVIRRLRALKEPVTLFGETDEQRFERMLLAEQNVQVGSGGATCGTSHRRLFGAPVQQEGNQDLS
jgi:hypothetical protein